MKASVVLDIIGLGNVQSREEGWYIAQTINSLRPSDAYMRQ